MILVAACQGCARFKTLKPAFEANEQNLKEVKETMAHDAELFEKMGVTIYDLAITSRRWAVADELATIGLALGKQSYDSWVKSDNSTAKELARLNQNWAVASKEAQENLRRKHPVLTALITLDLTPSQVERDAKWVANEGKSNSILGQPSIDKYPSVKELLMAKAKFQESAKKRREILEKQLQLATSHAALFVYAEKSSASGRQLAASVLGNAALREEALGLLKDEKWKTAASEAFNVLSGMLNSEKDKSE